MYVVLWRSQCGVGAGMQAGRQTGEWQQRLRYKFLSVKSGWLAGHGVDDEQEEADAMMLGHSLRRLRRQKRDTHTHTHTQQAIGSAEGRGARRGKARLAAADAC